MKHIIEDTELQNIKNTIFNDGRTCGYSDAMDLIVGVLEGDIGKLRYNTLSPKNEKALNLLLKARQTLDKIK